MKKRFLNCTGYKSPSAISAFMGIPDSERFVKKRSVEKTFSLSTQGAFSSSKSSAEVGKDEEETIVEVDPK